jgi:hypothetical protein
MHAPVADDYHDGTPPMTDILSGHVCGMRGEESRNKAAHAHSTGA